MLNHWIWLSTRKDMTEREIAAVYEYFGDPESVYYAEAQSYRQIPGIRAKAVGSLCDKSLDEARKIIQRCAHEQIHILSFQDAAYPRRLKAIPDPPMVLYYKGILPDFDETLFIGAVGTRSCTEYGMKMARQMGYQLGRAGAVVISGMAEGIDAGVIGGALAADGCVVGILGCGVDRIYPASNGDLFEGALKKGCLISEFPPGMRPYKWNFPKRNRLISGMSHGVLIVEAPEKSGAMITARQALDHGKELYAVPGNANAASAKGSNQLIMDGASVAQCGRDILERFSPRFPELKICDEECPDPAILGKMTKLCRGTQSSPERKTEKFSSNYKIDIDNPAKQPYIDVEKHHPQLSDEERAIVAQLSQGARNLDEVVCGAGLSMGKAMSLLTMLEIKGVIRRRPGNIIDLQE